MFMPDIINYWFSLFPDEMYPSGAEPMRVTLFSVSSVSPELLLPSATFTRVHRPIDYSRCRAETPGSKWPSMTALNPCHPAYRERSHPNVCLLMDSHLIGHTLIWGLLWNSNLWMSASNFCLSFLRSWNLTNVSAVSEEILTMPQTDLSNIIEDLNRISNISHQMQTIWPPER